MPALWTQDSLALNHKYVVINYLNLMDITWITYTVHTFCAWNYSLIDYTVVEICEQDFD